VTGGTPGTPFVLDSGLVTFDANGQLTSPAADVAVNVAGWSNGAGAQTVNWLLFDSAGQGRLTGFAAPSAVSSSTQNGYGAGELRSLVIDQDGLVSGVFSNGANIQLAILALATFNNDNGLLRNGRNTYVETNSSGIATIGTPNTGGRGATVSGSLELSNVDITEEFTDLIISQRGYQANSRIITTSDEVIQEALNLKR
jgi:flagellar hook protein FlgE